MGSHGPTKMLEELIEAEESTAEYIDSVVLDHGVLRRYGVNTYSSNHTSSPTFACV